VNGSTTKLGASYFFNPEAQRGIATGSQTFSADKVVFLFLTITLQDKRFHFYDPGLHLKSLDNNSDPSLCSGFKTKLFQPAIHQLAA
jgi:hypothetical protein